MDSVTIEELKTIVDRQRKAFGIVEQQTKTAAEAVAFAPATLPMARQTDEALEVLRAADAKRRAEKSMRENWSSLVAKRGERYRNCRFDSFRIDSPDQQKQVSRIEAFAKDVAGHCKAGSGLLMFGPKGTGKDHLVMCVAREAIKTGLVVHWINGADMRGDVRDGTKSETLERDYVRRLTKPDVLWISDPLPVGGTLTEAQQDRLFRVLDDRYSAMKPTWITVNVMSGTELDERLGPQNADRVRDGALAVFCNWPTNRQVMK